MIFGRGLGLSAQAISGHGNHHPWDPSDLLRCVNYCAERGITTEALAVRMQGRSTEWDRLLPEWDSLTSLLAEERESRSDHSAPLTYRAMKRVLAGGIKCLLCEGSGRGIECAKCKGTGHRSGGKCRADGCYQGAHLCESCRGNGYLRKEDK